MKIFDSHAHFYDERHECTTDELVQKVINDGITNVINVGASNESSKIVVEQCEKYDFMYGVVGIHPEEANSYNIDLSKIKELTKNPKIVGIGEIGLDYHYDGINKDMQQELFINQIKLANELKLPIVIHNRESSIDTIHILRNIVDCEKKGVFHCCEMNMELIKSALELEYYISFAGPITFKNAKKSYDVVNMVPMDRLLIETDSPYLAPEPLRGTVNTSSNVKLVAKKIAEFKEMTIEEVSEITYQNTKRLFAIM